MRNPEKKTRLHEEPRKGETHGRVSLGRTVSVIEMVVGLGLRRGNGDAVGLVVAVGAVVDSVADSLSVDAALTLETVILTRSAPF